MMIASRRLFIAALVSGSAVLSMQSMYKQNMDIDYVLAAVLCPPCGADGVAVVKSYLANGGNINAKGTVWVSSQEMRRMSLLMVSALVGYAKLMRFLLENNVRLNSKSGHGNTALMMAAINGRTGLVKLLLGAGADPLVRNDKHYGVTALWQAENSPIRHYPLHNCDNKYYNFPIMIKHLKKAEISAAPRKHEKIKNSSQLRMQQH